MGEKFKIPAFTPPSEAEIEACWADKYARMRQDKNNISYWLPRVQNRGIHTPETMIFDVPYEVARCFIADDPRNSAVEAFLSQNVRGKMGDGQYFIKNGTFSDKFCFSECVTDREKLLWSFISINYSAAILGAGGLSELALRELIPCDSSKTPCIYGGLPLRTEIRCFYDFDAKKLIGSVDYWDYGYVFPKLYDRTDQIIFEHERGRMADGYARHLPRVERLVADCMPDAELEGKWSVDLLVDEKGEVWLIDMALAEQSAYWERFRESA